jgi:SAM-dependent methyltransferase
MKIDIFVYILSNCKLAMHKSAYNNIENYTDRFLKKIEGKQAKILDVGSMDVNGTLKPIFKNRGWQYTGIDISAGKNVDIVLSNHYKYPFPDNTFDAAVSSSCFEHDEMFWLTFKEVVRVIKDGGYFFLCAPYKDGIHRVPVDCWRFLPDGYKALCKWEPQATLVDSFIDTRPHRDCCGAFQIQK